MAVASDDTGGVIVMDDADAETDELEGCRAGGAPEGSAPDGSSLERLEAIQSQAGRSSTRGATNVSNTRLPRATRLKRGEALVNMLRRPAFIVTAVAIAVALAGCQRFGRVEECRSLARIVNPVLRSIDASRKKSPENAHVYRAIATQYDSLWGAVWGLKVQGKRMQDVVGEYQKLLREASRDSRLFAEALQAKDPARIAAARASATRTVKREGAVVSRVDGVCRGR